MAAPRSHDWVALRDEWVATNLALEVPGSLSFKAFAKDKGLNYEHMRTWASRDRWKDRLTQAVAERSEQAIAVVQEDTGQDEAKVRGRHANALRYIGAKALNALRLKTDEDWRRMSLAELVKIAERATAGERDAMGLPDRHEVVPAVGSMAGFESVQEKLAKHKELVELGDDFLRYVEQRKRREARRRAAITVEAEVVESPSPETNAIGGTPVRAPSHAPSPPDASDKDASDKDGPDKPIAVDATPPGPSEPEESPVSDSARPQKSDKKIRDATRRRGKGTPAHTRARAREDEK